MILTKDNLIKFVKQQKTVTPTDVAKEFDTTTMIASATLSELVKEKLILITHLKLSSSPYYYDPKQKQCLYELGLKHYSGYDKEIMEKLKKLQVLNVNSLNIQEALAIERIKDLAKVLEIEYNGKKLKFYVWYLRDMEETKKQILDAIKIQDSSNDSKNKISTKQNIKKDIKKQEISKQINSQIPNNNNNLNTKTNLNQYNNRDNLNNDSLNNNRDNFVQIKDIRNNQFSPKEIKKNQTENFIENYLRNNYLQIDSKNKSDKTIKYIANLHVNKIKVSFECIYYYKKPSEFEIITFYSSSINPKIIFVENAPKKIYKLAENLTNLTIVNI